MKATRVIPNRGLSDADYLLTRRTVVEGSGCWEWTGAVSSVGYGSTTPTRPGSRLAHRLSYLTFVSDIPDGFHVDHLCKNQKCFNPDHLEAVEPRVNTLRGNGPSSLNAKKAHCPHGHLYSPENTRTDPKSGKRFCRSCQRARAKAYRAALRMIA